MKKGLGVGEACDPERFNTSILVVGGSKKHYILLDCGFTTPHRYFADCFDPDQLEALWISHFHGDHFFGVPLLLLRFWEMGRVKPLLLAGPDGLREKIEMALDLAYPSFLGKLRYALEYRELEDGDSFQGAGFLWQVAATEHSQPDGRYTVGSANLAKGCTLMVHEAYRVAGQTANHGSLAECLALARQAGCEKLAIVHVAHYERERKSGELRRLLGESGLPGVFLPEPGESLDL
ncbi:MAG: metal-dependent hydrolase [Deltaproteobacteria bacterium HGW-Deltaproteobacteria-3]|nr:MAG: metal-dependent hydrolase [Deltaproteobacteria bacterium HGW-Deltaproteobacteria-3]